MLAHAPASRGRAGEPALRLIEPRRPGAPERAREFWRYRRLVPYFGRRFVEKLYLRTWLGWAWLPLRPILDVVAGAVVFGGILTIPSNGKPYLLFFLIGTAAWRLFSGATYWAARSVELNRRFLRLMYLPRLILLTASTAPPLAHFLVYVTLTVMALGGYAVVDGEVHVRVQAATLLAPVGLGLAVALALTTGLFTSVYGAQARDVRFSLNYLLGVWYFFTPVIYPLSAVPSGFRTVAELNPVTAPVEMVRFGMLGTGGVPATGLAITIATILVLGAAGLRFFLRSEAEALDHL